MKKMLTTEESYRHRIEFVMQYIKKNIDKEINIPRLSAVFGFTFAFTLARGLPPEVITTPSTTVDSSISFESKSNSTF